MSGRGLCDELITRPEEFYRLWCVVVCDLETSRMRRPWPALDRSATEKKKFCTIIAVITQLYIIKCNFFEFQRNVGKCKFQTFVARRMRVLKI